MNTLKRIATGVGGVVIVALLLAVAMPKAAHAIVSTLVTVANTAENPVPVQSVKRSEANFVTLTENGGSNFMEAMPDGSTTPFSIPEGQLLVITDVSWTTVCESLFTITCSRNVGDVVVVTFGSPVIYATGPISSQGTYAENNFLLTASGSVSLKSGYIVSQLPAPQIFLGATGSGENILGFTISGYLVPAPPAT